MMEELTSPPFRRITVFDKGKPILAIDIMEGQIITRPARQGITCNYRASGVVPYTEFNTNL